MTRILWVAWREFTATVLTKGFIFGVMIMPVIMTIAIPVAIKLIKIEPPPVRGSIAVIDRTGAALTNITTRLSEESLRESITERARREMSEGAKQASKKLGTELSGPMGAAGETAMKMAAASIPSFTIEPLAPGADAEEAKRALLASSSPNHDEPTSRLAVVVVQPDAVVRAPDTKAFGTFEIYHVPRLDARVQGLLSDQVRRAIVDARLSAGGQDPTHIRDLLKLDDPKVVAVTKEGEKESGEMQQMMLPLAFMILLWVSVFSGGQYLLTSTIEEKSNRIMEVLLSAVSPMQLMTGKILGQMGAGLLILLIYSGLGLAALLAFSLLYLITPLNLLFLIVFFFLAFFMIASMMAAVGSAVNDTHEAQTLLTPIMLIVMLPMLLMMPIIWNPNSALATTLSFLPPINPFVMVLRICSTTPPPLWQVLLSIAVGVVGVLVMLRGAAKIFRIGVLMYGKPPNFATLIRWIRMA